MKSWMSRASSWNVVEVVRPQPGQAATSGTNVRKPMVCSSSCATFTSSVRSPFGSGVSETRMVSPMPCCSSTPMRGRRRDDALRSHAGLGEAEMQRVVGAARQLGIDRDQVLHRRHLGRQDDAVARQADLLGALRPTAAPTAPSPRASLRARRAAPPSAEFSSIRWVSSSWSSEPQLAPMRTGLPCLIAISTICANCGSRLSLKPTLPGLMRYLSSASAQPG